MTLTILDTLDQGSDEWHDQRRGMLTASVVGQLIGTRYPTAIEYPCPDCDAGVNLPCLSKARSSAGPSAIKTLHPGRTSLAASLRETSPPELVVADTDASRGVTATLIAERITGWTEPTYTTDDMWRGIESEPIARDLYARTTGQTVTEVGFMVRELAPGVRLGYSPDGLVGEHGLIEVKAPRAKTHIMTILADKIPPSHMAQCQAGLLVSGREWLDFISYCGGLPPFVKRVLPDEQWFDAIRAAGERFEETATRMQADYRAKTHGRPTTERLVTTSEIQIGA